MTPAVKAGLVYFVLAFAAGFLLGTFRVTFLLPRFGPTVAVLIEIPMLLAICWNACGIVLRHLPVPNAATQRLVMGVVAFGCLMVAEIAFATLAFGQSLSQHFTNYATAPGAIGLTGQVLFALIPLVRRAAETGGDG